MTVGIGTGVGSTVPSDEELAEYEQERPARRFRPALDRAIAVWCAIVSVGVLLQVFFPLPQGTQFYLVIFLAAVLPITLLCYRGWKVPAFLSPFKSRSHDDPEITDWILAVVRTSAGIDSIADLKGKRVSTGSPNSGTEVIARRLLEAAGLDPAKDVTAQRLGLPESVDAMKSGSIDALVWSGGLPTGGITDLTTSMGKDVKLIPIVDLLPAMQEKYGPVYSQAPIPAATYKQPADVPTIVVPNVLLVRKNMHDDLAEQLTKVVYENKDALVAVNAAAKGIDLANADKTEPVEVHPGAKKAIDGLR